MTREVKCFVTNETGKSLNFSGLDISHGELHGTALNSIPADAHNLEVFYMHKTTGSLYGVTGNVSYLLPNNARLTFMFNNPYTWQGSGETGNCWFYTVVNGVPSTGPEWYPEVQVEICQKHQGDCATMQLDPPTNNEVINAFVTILPIPKSI